jgi:pilus assembly protein FimV
MSTLASALALACAGGDALALGVGGLRTQSALNQPFVGEIDLLDVRPDELDTVKAQLASPADFAKVGSERYHYLTQLRFTPQISPRGNTVIRVSSREPIREPYMDFLVEVTWPSGRLVKGYTVLLDPPATAGARAAPVEAPVAAPRAITPAPAPRRAPASSSSAPSSAPAERPPSPPPVTASAGDFPKRIGPIRPGAGLWRLARNNAPSGATVPQTAMALYRNNQGAFIRGDINRVIVGKVLTIPSAAELFALTPEQAEREFEAAMRGEKVRAAPIADTSPDAAGGESRLKIAGAAGDSGTPDGAPADAPGTSDTMEEELLLVRETSETARQETLELRNRIRELEEQLTDIQQLLTLRSAELARIQGVAGDADATQAPLVTAQAPGPVDEPASDESSPLPADLEAALAAAGGLPGAGLGATDDVTAMPDVPEADMVAPEGPSPSDEDEVASVVDETEGETVTAVAEDTPVERTSVAVAPTTSSGAEAPAAEPGGAVEGEEPGWKQFLVPVAGAAGATALGLGLIGWLRARRRREEDLDWEAEESDLPLPKAPATRRGPSPKPSAVPPMPDAPEDAPVESPADASAAPGQAEPGTDDADVISEADIYIAYGRYREAVDLLREELDRSPRQLEVKLKLAEAYFGAKNFPALSELMEDLRTNSREEVTPDQWKRLSEMASGSQSEALLQMNRVAPAKTFASPGVAPGSAGVDPEHSAEAFFSLDISDMASPSADLSPQSVLEDSDSFERGAAPSKPENRRKPAPLPSGDDTLLALDDEPLKRPAGLDMPSDGLGLDAPSMSELGPDYSGGASDLEVTIDDLRAASDLDLDSFVDSTRTSTFADELDLAQDERVSRPSGPGGGGAGSAATTETAERGRTLGAAGPEAGRGDVGSSDLLTSQWQMDSGLWDETATKLDLARAYIEMGDQDSARGILEEVVAEGSDSQRGEATELLRGLA